jgi:predicted O-methyltransferase YrrM
LALITTKPRLQRWPRTRARNIPTCSHGGRYFALSDISTSALARLPRLARAVITNPAECVTRAISEVRALPERSQPPCPYVVDSKWEEELHNCLGRKSACGSGSELQALWPDVFDTLAARGVTAGPMSYLGWNDGDPEFVRAIWCLVRHLGAQRVVETGVAHGVTSRFVLEALARNGGGHLWSIDLPPVAHPELHWQIGIAVHKHLREHWTYIAGSSRRRLIPALKKVGTIDLFVHDSAHTASNVLFEMSHAWEALRPGGAIVVDDIDANWGFQRFCESMPLARAWICQSAPIRPDHRRVDDKGKFGIILKPN